MLSKESVSVVVGVSAGLSFSEVSVTFGVSIGILLSWLGESAPRVFALSGSSSLF